MPLGTLLNYFDKEQLFQEAWPEEKAEGAQERPFVGWDMGRRVGIDDFFWCRFCW